MKETLELYFINSMFSGRLRFHFVCNNDIKKDNTVYLLNILNKKFMLAKNYKTF